MSSLPDKVARQIYETMISIYKNTDDKCQEYSEDDFPSENLLKFDSKETPIDVKQASFDVAFHLDVALKKYDFVSQALTDPEKIQKLSQEQLAIIASRLRSLARNPRGAPRIDLFNDKSSLDAVRRYWELRQQNISSKDAKDEVLKTYSMRGIKTLESRITFYKKHGYLPKKT